MGGLLPPGSNPRDGDCADMPSFMTNADRIVGGQDAPSPIPWQVSVQIGYWHFCGATILDESTLLSAAHCFYESSAWDLSIRAGSVKKGNGGQVVNISQIIWNTNSGFEYNPGTLDNDFVVLKLASALTLNDDVKPACLPSSATYLDVSSAEEQCFTSGWGSLSSGGSSPNTCQFVRVPAITNAACNNDYGGDITDAMICAGYPGVGGKDACQGDSGGPFVCNDNGNAVIAGVVSWGNGCALADFPGVYARTTTALSWIQSNMGSCAVAPSPPSPPPPSPSPPPPSPSPPSNGCGFPQWKGDGYCDDENNNDSCNYDGGDCCGDDVNTSFCSACQCLDPDFGSDDSGEDDCEDNRPTAWCEKKKGKCNKNGIKQKCPLTCGVCTD